VKLVHITYHFEFSDLIEKILDRNGIQNFVRSPMVEGKDSEGKHFGTQVFPGNTAMVQAQVQDDKVPRLLKELERFRSLKPSHQHLQAVVLPIEQRL